MKFIALKNSNRFAIVDDEDYEAVMEFQWSLAEPSKGHFYARKTKGGQRFMHRVVADRAGLTGEAIDHRNHAGLDNRRANLRGCSAMENCWNSRRKVGASGCPGVSKNGKGWVVKFRHAKQCHYFGFFLDLEQAKEVAMAAMAHLRGEFAPPQPSGKVHELRRRA